MSKLDKENGDGLAIHYEKILKTPHDRPWTGTNREKGRGDVQDRPGKGAYKMN